MYLSRYRWIDRHQFIEIAKVYVEYYNSLVRRGVEKIPMPPLADLEKVGSIIEATDGYVFGTPKYPLFGTKVAVAYYEINKGHHFYNGNKRLATFTLLYLLRLNGYTLPWQQWELVDLALKVAKSKGTKRSRAIWTNRITRILQSEAEPWT